MWIKPTDKEIPYDEMLIMCVMVNSSAIGSYPHIFHGKVHLDDGLIEDIHGDSIGWEIDDVDFWMPTPVFPI